MVYKSSHDLLFKSKDKKPKLSPEKSLYAVTSAKGKEKKVRGQKPSNS